MRIVIETIPHSEQRYPTLGDWQFDEAFEELTISVSQTFCRASNNLIAVHELIEALLCEQRGITQVEVDAFDTKWLPHDGLFEPGDDPDAPYHREHLFADTIERLMAQQMLFNWRRHESICNRTESSEDQQAG